MARIEEAALHDRLEWNTPLFRKRAVMLSVPVKLDARGLHP